ncbi:MAG: N-acyl-D-amino-acid deacylase [Paraglaciecola sp.]|jgi:N-acyl-D-amino-acid deacylase
MKKRIQLTILWVCCLQMLSCNPTPAPFLAAYPNIDLLITNGNVLDGLGNKAVAEDVVVVNDKIVFIGKTAFDASELKQRVKLIIDAKQRIVAPGFIDLHAHGSPLKTPAFENFLAMGVTTITLGQDGDSPEVLDLKDWLNKVKEQGTAVNITMFVGHGTLRILSGISRTVEPTSEQLQPMFRLLDDTLKYTFGMSTGLEYNPGLNALPEEMAGLAKIVGNNNRLLMSHVRNEDDDQIETSLKELFAQGEFCKVHVSHIKSVYGKGRKRAHEILALLKEAKKSGIDVSADIYPYNASYAGVSLLFPVWAKTTEQFQLALVTRRAELETFLRNKITRRNGPEATLLGTAPNTGKTLAQLSQEMDIPFEQVLIKIGPKGAAGAYFIMDDELQSALLVDPMVSISSDGRMQGFHPRGHGTFAKIIDQYVIQRGVLTLEEAIRKMTSQSAKVLGLLDRGVLQAGKKADIIIFNPKNIKAMATYPEPHKLAQGFDVVIVNGQIARQEGKVADNYFGEVLQPDRD